MNKRNPARRSAGFSLVEITISLVVIAMIVGVVAVRSGGVVNRGRTTHVIQLVDTLKKASAQYHADTGEMPREYAGGAANDCRLSGAQTVAGWRGPYIESPLTTAMNPSGNTLNLYDTPAVQGNAGFDTDADGVNDVTSSACTLWLSGVTQADAQAIDAAFDKGVGGNWYDTGRVKWSSSTAYCWVLVYW